MSGWNKIKLMVMTKSRKGNVGRIFARERLGKNKNKNIKFTPNKIKSYILRKYNLSKNEYNKLYKNQNGQCAICGTICKNHFDKSTINIRTFNIDHCHKTGKVRGLLCGGCNSMIGHADDNIEILLSAIDYLRKNNL